MASRQDTLDFISEQISDAGIITYKKCLVNMEYIVMER